MRRILVETAALAALLASVMPTTAATVAQKCQDAVSSAAVKYFDARFKAISQCRDARAVTGLPADCTTDPGVTTALFTATNRLINKINGNCPDSTIAQTDLGLSCKGAANPADLVTCITTSAHAARVDRLVDAGYDGSAQITDPGVRNCQVAIGKALRKDTRIRQKARRKCAAPLTLVAGAGGLCPDALAHTKLDKARDSLISKVQKKCGSGQVLDASLKFGSECGDTRVGAPAAVFQYMTFDRVGVTSTNSIPANVRLSRCLAATAAVEADTASDSIHALSDLGEFTHGVAAGDATDTSFIAWTRVPSGASPLTLEVATNAGFAPLVQSIPGLVPNPARDYTIKVDVTGLTSSTQYFYRFTGLLPSPFKSRTGRVRTAPSPASTAPIEVAFTGDSNAFFRPFSVLEGITRDDPELFLYIGDTIYGDDERSGTGEAIVLDDYRVKYAENRDDRALRDVMANVGTATIWDDHEVTNDFYGSPFGAFGPQILAGNQAFREWMPMREDIGDPMKLYRSLKWGDVAEFFLIDDRQYRSSQAYITEPACLSAGEPAVLPNATCTAEINNPSRVYLGTAQKAWLKAALVASTAKWKFVMNGPLLSSLLFLPYDRWEGYGAERTEMLEFFRNPDGVVMTDDHLKNVVFLSTDIHAAIYNTGVVNPGPSGGSVREIVAGAIGMDAIYRELPPAILPLVGSLPSLFSTIQFFDIDRRNYVHIAATTANATFTWRDNTGSTLKVVTLTAE